MRARKAREGWVFASLLATAYKSLPDEMPPAQLQELRQTFFAGAQHLFGSIMLVNATPDAADVSHIALAGDNFSHVCANSRHRLVARKQTFNFALTADAGARRKANIRLNAEGSPRSTSQLIYRARYSEIPE